MCVCVCVGHTDTFCRWFWWRQTWGDQPLLRWKSGCIPVASCFIRSFHCPILSLASPALVASTPCLHVVLALLWWGVTGGDHGVPPGFPSCSQYQGPPDGSPRQWDWFFCYGDNKGFHQLMSYDLHTCRSNVSVIKAAVIVKELSPKSMPTNESLPFLYLLIQFCLQFRRDESFFPYQVY